MNIPLCCTLQVWTYNSRVAFVISVVENEQPIKDLFKLQKLRELLQWKMDTGGSTIVNISSVRVVSL
jgi:hypothetical protein